MNELIKYGLKKKFECKLNFFFSLRIISHLLKILTMSYNNNSVITCISS